LVEHFLARLNARMGLAISGISAEALRLLAAYNWPGNVRELENTIERAVVLSEGPEIDVDALPERVHGAGQPAEKAPLDDGDLSIKKASRRSEESLIRRALERTKGNRTRAAELLEISHRALLYKIREYGIANSRDTREHDALAGSSEMTPPPTTPAPVGSTWRAK
ncbi:MAG TPA: helix-turn-helix domain-containing protein, partial [Polyangia bacterium]